MDKYFFLKENIIYEKEESINIENNKYFYNRDIKVGTNQDIDIEGVGLLIGKKVILIKGDVYKNYVKVEDTVIDFEVGDNLIIDQKIKIMYMENKVLDIKVFDNDIKINLLKVNDISKEYEEYPEYTNSPRVKKKLPNDDIKLETPPEKDKDITLGSLLKKLIPAIVGVVIAILMLKIRPRGIRGIIMFFSMLVSFTISMITLYEDRKANKEYNKRRKKIYIKYLLDKRKELTSLKNEQNATQKYNNLSQIDILDEVYRNTYRLYERDQIEEDFLTLKVGEVSKKASYNMINPFENIQLKYEELELKLKDLYEEYKDNEKTPILIDFRKFNVGLIGSRFVINKQIHNILSQIYFNHSYLDLNVVVITSEDNASNFEYLRWLKHFKNISTGFNNIIVDSVTRDQGLAAYEQVLRQRVLEHDKDVMYKPHFLFIIENTKIMKSHPIMEYLQKDNVKYGFSLMYLVNEENELPDNVSTIINFLNENEAILKLNEGHFENLKFRLDDVESDVQKLDLVTRKIGELEHIKGVKSSIPESLGFLEMYGVGEVQDLEIAKRWDNNKSYESLRALLGKKSQVDEVYLDLHEKYHGPHGLIAGTTGSGKSEVIQTYILSLALNYSPEEVGFLLIDYKGGGMANLFKNMPHHLGSITNLDGYQSMRALASIKSELKRRQRIFSECDVNHINGYHKLYEKDKVDEPLPHLFLISDEFAELKTEQPEFMKELVSAARIGRSLGIHLILATQKPSGVVDEQIWSNSKFKLSLKVAEESDSKELLRTPDAAYIIQPGRGYLKVGTNELYELFQSGYSGAPYQKESSSKVDKRIFEVDTFGKASLINEDILMEEDEKENKEVISELTVTLDEITNVYKTKSYKEVPKPWLEPLKEFISMNQNIDYKLGENYKVNLGLVDIPDQQLQKEFSVDVQNGNILITGESKSGKTTLLETLMLRLAMQNDSKNLKFFILDFGNNGLIQMKKLNHVAEYIGTDNEEMNNFISVIKTNIYKRKKLLEKNMFSSYIQYNNANEKKLQTTVIVIDKYEMIKEYNDEFDGFLTQLLREGEALGIFVVCTVSRYGEMKAIISNSFQKNIALYTSDKAQLREMFQQRSDYDTVEIPGRGQILVEKPEVCQFYAPYINKTKNEIEQIEEQIEKINSISPFENYAFVKMVDKVDYDLPTVVTENIYVGLSYNDVKDKRIKIDNMLLTGNQGSGKTNMLKLILEQIKLLPNKKILIIDDMANSLAEYQEYDNIDYVTDILEIETEYDYYVINKMSRINKLKQKDVIPLYEEFYKEVVKGKKFIIEDSKGPASKEEFALMFKKPPLVLYFGSALSQKYVNVSRKDYSNEKIQLSDMYLIVNQAIEKIKSPLVTTGNEGKIYTVEEKTPVEPSKTSIKNDKFEFTTQFIYTEPESINSILDSFKSYANKKNKEVVVIEKPKEILSTKDEILILDGNFLNNLRTIDRKAVYEVLDTRVLENQQIIVYGQEKLKGTGEFVKKMKKHDLMLINSDLDKQNIIRIKNRNHKEEKQKEGYIFKVKNQKDITKIKL